MGAAATKPTRRGVYQCRRRELCGYHKAPDDKRRWDEVSSQVTCG